MPEGTEPAFARLRRRSVTIDPDATATVDYMAAEQCSQDFRAV